MGGGAPFEFRHATARENRGWGGGGGGGGVSAEGGLEGGGGFFAPTFSQNDQRNGEKNVLLKRNFCSSRGMGGGQAAKVGGVGDQSFISPFSCTFEFSIKFSAFCVYTLRVKKIFPSAVCKKKTFRHLWPHRFPAKT